MQEHTRWVRTRGSLQESWCWALPSGLNSSSARSCKTARLWQAIPNVPDLQCGWQILLQSANTRANHIAHLPTVRGFRFGTR